DIETKQDKRTNKLKLINGGKAASATDHPDDGDETWIQKTYWFHLLQPEHQDTALDHALECIANNSKLFELEADGGNNTEYHNLVTAIARSNAPHAEDIFVKYASTAKDADREDKLREYFARCEASQPPSSGQGITVGTLIYVAQKHGANFEPWRRLVPTLPILPPHMRPLLKGGNYKPNEALELLNSWFLIGQREYEPAAVHRINDNESLTFLKTESFKLEVQHILSDTTNRTKQQIADWPCPANWADDRGATTCRRVRSGKRNWTSGWASRSLNTTDGANRPRRALKTGICKVWGKPHTFLP